MDIDTNFLRQRSAVERNIYIRSGRCDPPPLPEPKPVGNIWLWLILSFAVGFGAMGIYEMVLLRNY